MKNFSGIPYTDKTVTAEKIYRWIVDCDILVHVHNFYGVVTVFAPDRKTTVAILDGLYENDELSTSFYFTRLSNEVITIIATK